jgi:DNA-binding NarL/FixJ family response regulator
LVASEQALLSAAQEAGCHFVVLDLSLPGCQPASIVAQLKASYPNVKLVAYAPHVHVALLQSAADAGCHAVLTRGQFHQQLPQLLEQYLG